MSAIKSTKVNESASKAKISKVKPNKEIKKKCQYAIPCTSAKALKLFNEGKPIVKGDVLKAGTENEYIKMMFSQCTKSSSSFEDEENCLCKTHLAIQEKGEKQIFMFNELQENPYFSPIESVDDPYLSSKRGSKSTPKKNKLSIPQDIMDDPEIYDEFMEEFKALVGNNLQKINKKNYDSIEKKDCSPIQMVIKEKPKKKVQKKEVIVQEEEIEHFKDHSEEEEQEPEHDCAEEEEQEEIQDVVESDEEEQEDSDYTELETQDGSTYYFKDNSIFDEDENKLGPIIEVNDDKAPFCNEGHYYCVFKNIDFKGKEHYVCAISNRVYFNNGSSDEPEYEYQGMAKYKKNGEFNGIKKN